MNLLDEQYLVWINHALGGPVLTPFFVAVTTLGNALVLAALILPLWAKRDRLVLRQHFWTFVLSIALSGVLVNVLKIVIDRPRPVSQLSGIEGSVDIPLGTPPDRSMPSGHTQTAVSTAVYLSCVYPNWAGVFLGAGLLVGLSRMVLGVHYPSDVLVGGAFGALFALLGYWYAIRKQGKPESPSLGD